MIFREASIEDLSLLRELEQKLIEAERPFDSHVKPGNPTYYDIEKLILDEDCCLVVAEDTNTIIATGYAQLTRTKPSLIHNIHSYLGFMYVAPDYRGKGINKTIIEQLISWTRSKGVNAIYLDVYSGNNSAIKAYEKMSFEPSLLEMKLIL
ncbi:MAG: GNAT superfamily N-acetyltransferase [Parasphingorhabdus sp.]